MGKEKFEPFEMEYNELFNLPMKNYFYGDRDSLPDPYPTYRKVGKKYYPISEEISRDLKKNGYSITGLINRSRVDVFSGTSSQHGEVAILIGPQNKSSIYSNLINVDTGITATIHYYKIFGDTEVLVEEKALITIDDFCRTIADQHYLSKINLVRGLYDWVNDSGDILREKYSLVYIDNNPGNIAIFQDGHKFKIKWIDLDSLEPYVDTQYSLDSFDIIVMLDTLFPKE